MIIYALNLLLKVFSELCRRDSQALKIMSHSYSSSFSQGQLERELDQMIVSYRDDPDLQSLIDWIQKDWLQCCGIKDADDWDLNIYFNKSSKGLGSPEAGGVPFSCCQVRGMLWSESELQYHS